METGNRNTCATVALGIAIACCNGLSFGASEKPAVEVYRITLPDGERPIPQGSGLVYGSLGSREGLWLVCDRNSAEAANAVFFISRKDLGGATPNRAIRVTERIAIDPPGEGWASFQKRFSKIPAERIKDLERQVANGMSGGRPVLDLEGITIGTSGPDRETRLFVLAEQPNSLVLELAITQEAGRARAMIEACYAYEERPEEKGADANDGLEGIAWSGRPDEFFLVEEGTKPHRADDTLHFFQRPRLLRAKLEAGRVVVDEDWSADVTTRLWELQKKSTHTLNAACMLDGETVAVVDRNGGWIFVVDPQRRTIRPWLNLYDPKFLNLRERLAKFPGVRRMPYVSMEGIARDANGDLWMVDDPAMPEGFRASCLIRVRRPPPIGE